MTFEFKFSRLERVKIIPIERITGRIFSRKDMGDGPQYSVTYFVDGSEKNANFLEDELEGVG